MKWTIKSPRRGVMTPEQIERATLALKAWPMFVADPVLADAVVLAVLTAVEPLIAAHVRAEVADEIAEAITANVRNEDWSKQDRGGFYGVVPKMAYVGGHDKAADIARSLREVS